MIYLLLALAWAITLAIVQYRRQRGPSQRQLREHATRHAVLRLDKVTEDGVSAMMAAVMEQRLRDRNGRDVS